MQMPLTVTQGREPVSRLYLQTEFWFTPHQQHPKSVLIKGLRTSNEILAYQDDRRVLQEESELKQKP